MRDDYSKIDPRLLGAPAMSTMTKRKILDKRPGNRSKRPRLEPHPSLWKSAATDPFKKLDSRQTFGPSSNSRHGGQVIEEKKSVRPRVFFYIIQAQGPRLESTMWKEGKLGDKSLQSVIKSIAHIISCDRIQQLHFTLRTRTMDMKITVQKDNERAFEQLKSE